MRIEFDKEADALYMYLSKKKIVRTVPVSENIIIDFDEKGGIVGIEMLSVSRQISAKSLKQSLKTGIPVFA